MKFTALTAAAGISLLTATAAVAAPITFDLSGFSDAASVTLSSSGVNLTIDNGINGGGGAIDIRNALGGFVASDSGSLAQANFTFSQDVRLVSFVVSNEERDGDGAFFNLTQGAFSSLNNAVDAVGGPFAFSNISDLFTANTAIQFLAGDSVANLSGSIEFEAFAISEITVATVPVPAGGLLLLSAFGGVAALKRRKKATA